MVVGGVVGVAVVVASVSAAVDIAVVVVAGRVGQLSWTGSIGWVTGLRLGGSVIG